VLQTLASRAGDARARASDLLAKLEPQLEDVEQALALKRDITRVVPAATTGSAAADDWILFGNQPWLVGVARVSGRTPVVVAVRARVLLPDIAREMSALPSAGATVEFVTDGSTGEAVDRAFPGLRVNLAINEDATTSGWRLQRTYYIVALLIVVAVTASGGYSLWRNLRREMRLAELRSQFVSSVSHELRTPLTAIRMFAETLQLERPLDSPTRAEYLGTIVNESERLTRLLNNVLDFSKIERGERVYRLEEAALDAVVRQAAGAMQYPLTRLGFALHVDVPDEMPPVRIDRDAIEQAVLNLLNNAMKYSRDCRDIALRLHAARGDAVIEVTDRGLGIAAADHQRIFERFYRAPVPENRLIPGTGLGLALVDHIVKGHGGRVEVRSAPGAGSTFAIHLPLAV
jgi:signal transduction histidine kinase